MGDGGQGRCLGGLGGDCEVGERGSLSGQET